MTLWRIVGLVVLLGPLWTPARFLALRGIPAGIRLLVGAGALAWAGAALWTAVSRPGWLLPLATIVLVGWGAMAWRARPGAGRRRGWPPGSLGVGASLRALSDYGYYGKEAARHGPVFKTSQYGRPVLCIVGLERCQGFLRDHRDRLASAPLPIDRDVAGGLLRYMEPARHATYRRLLQAAVKGPALAGAEPWFEERSGRGFARLAEASARAGSQGAPPWAAIDGLVFDCLAGVFFGVRPEDSASEELRRLFRIVDHRRPWRARGRTRAAMRDLAALVLEHSGRAPGVPAVDPDAVGRPASYLDQALAADPGLAGDPVFVENLVYLFHVARCDLTGLCGWLFKLLLDHPAWAERVRAERGRGDRALGSAAARFVDETLRLRQSEYLYRTVSAPIAFEGFSIPAGWLVRLCIRESHTSAEAHARPHVFEPDRFLAGTPASDRYQAFGIYDHACLGVPLTRSLGRIFVECLAGFRGEVARDGPMELGLHHHRHWTPSRRLRVRLRPLASAPGPVGPA